MRACRAYGLVQVNCISYIFWEICTEKVVNKASNHSMSICKDFLQTHADQTQPNLPNRPFKKIFELSDQWPFMTNLCLEMSVTWIGWINNIIFKLEIGKNEKKIKGNRKAVSYQYFSLEYFLCIASVREILPTDWWFWALQSLMG